MAPTTILAHPMNRFTLAESGMAGSGEIETMITPKTNSIAPNVALIRVIPLQTKYRLAAAFRGADSVAMRSRRYSRRTAIATDVLGSVRHRGHSKAAAADNMSSFDAGPGGHFEHRS